MSTQRILESRVVLVVSAFVLFGCDDVVRYGVVNIDVTADQSRESPMTGATACDIDVARELLVTDLSIVDDEALTTYPGPLSFGQLIDNMRGDEDAETFIRSWLSNYENDVVVNGFLVPSRPFFVEDVIQTWEQKSDENGVAGLDLNAAPFRLLAVVNRVDLRETCDENGHVKHAGEGRIVFGFIDPTADTTFGEEILRGTMILEYHLPAKTCDDVRSWAKRWHDLGNHPMGSKKFEVALLNIVDGFAGKNKWPSRPNGSALAQLRTNELVNEFPWQWREFHILNDGLFHQVTVANAMDSSLNGTDTMAKFVNDHEDELLSEGFIDIPRTYNGAGFEGGSSDGQPVSTLFYAEGINNNDARHQFALHTCVGCHTTETGVGFFQIGPRMKGEETVPSLFMSGIEHLDPVDGTVRSFADLKRRTVDLCGLLSSTCAEIAVHKTSARIH